MTSRPAFDPHVNSVRYALRAAVFVLGAVAALPGCKARPYSLGTAAQYRVAPELQAITDPQIERGKPRPVIDTVGWIIGIPDKIMLWDRRIENHDISLDTEAKLAAYLADNQLTAVKVRLNQYAPRDDWRRLVANKSVGAGWRYTFGAIAWLGETIFPGRIWGGDHYNPYSNTLNIYSDVPAVALHEGGHAKDFSGRKYPGTYAAVYAIIPVTPLYYEAVATRDAIGYLNAGGTTTDRRDAYEILYPAYGTYVGGSIGDFIPGYGLAVQAAAVVGGHVIGRVQASRMEANMEPPIGESTAEVIPAAYKQLSPTAAGDEQEIPAEHR